MVEFIKRYEEFIKGKELNPNGYNLFKKVLKKAANPKTKQRGSK